MTFAEWLKLAAGGILILGGLFVFVTSVIGNYRFPDAATRMHSAALGDTRGSCWSLRDWRSCAFPRASR